MASQTFYIALSKAKFGSLKGRLTIKNNGLKAGERLLQVNIKVPDELFTTPQLTTTIEIPKSSISAPVINAETVNNIQQTISQNLGVDLTISVVDKKEE